VRYGTILCKVTLTARPIRLGAAKVILALCLSKNGTPFEMARQTNMELSRRNFLMTESVRNHPETLRIPGSAFVAFR